MVNSSKKTNRSFEMSHFHEIKCVLREELLHSNCIEIFSIGIKGTQDDE